VPPQEVDVQRDSISQPERALRVVADVLLAVRVHEHAQPAPVAHEPGNDLAELIGGELHPDIRDGVRPDGSVAPAGFDGEACEQSIVDALGRRARRGVEIDVGMEVLAHRALTWIFTSVAPATVR